MVIDGGVVSATVTCRVTVVASFPELSLTSYERVYVDKIFSLTEPVTWILDVILLS